MKLSRCLAFASFAVLSAFFALPASAQSAPSGVDNFLKGLQVTGSLDGYATWNANSPQNGVNALYNFNVSADSFALNLAELKVVKPVSKPGDLGFTMELGYGQAVNTMQSSDPTTGDDGAKNLIQAYGAWEAAKGLEIDFGKFSTPIGAEVIETQANWNYSRSLLFALAIPYNHTGVRATYGLSKTVTIYGMVVNGWNNLTDNNRAKSFGTGFTWAPSAKWLLAENYIVGAEQTSDNKDYRQVTDTVLTYNATSKLSLMGNYDYGHDTISGVSTKWQGVAGYFRYQITPNFAITPRAEYYSDPQGFTTGAAQKLWEFTLTPEYKVGSHLLIRGEYRHDQSDQPFYQLNSGDLSKHQDTLTTGMIVYF